MVRTKSNECIKENVRSSSDIWPNSVLIFDLELVKIQDAPAAPAGGMPFPMPQGQPGGGGNE